MYPFFAEQPQNFSKNAFSANITNFEGGARAKKRNFLVKIFQKLPKNVFFWPVF